jgi:hypothetical protein
MLTKRLQLVEQDEMKLKESIEQFRHYLAHPNEIPDELRKSVLMTNETKQVNEQGE